ncbi:hypothetical protein Scep_019277 [Stephania cephalantha]|uniref:Uncharacterized protein n=1 Tax=Stephania cephalantha TaxID=152367 RepID=A0AAP0NM00_9MAGN
MLLTWKLLFPLRSLEAGFARKALFIIAKASQVRRTRHPWRKERLIGGQLSTPLYMLTRVINWRPRTQSGGLITGGSLVCRKTLERTKREPYVLQTYETGQKKIARFKNGTGRRLWSPGSEENQENHHAKGGLNFSTKFSDDRRWRTYWDARQRTTVARMPLTGLFRPLLAGDQEYSVAALFQFFCVRGSRHTKRDFVYCEILFTPRPSMTENVK